MKYLDFNLFAVQHYYFKSPILLSFYPLQGSYTNIMDVSDIRRILIFLCYSLNDVHKENNWSQLFGITTTRVAIASILYIKSFFEYTLIINS